MPTISLYFNRKFEDKNWAGITYLLDCPQDSKNKAEWCLGRAPDCDLTISIKEISRRHAAVSYSYAGNRWSLQDLGSEQGTFLGGVRLKPGDLHPIAIGDRFYLGPHMVNVVEDEHDTAGMGLGPPTVGSTQPITEWPTPTDAPAAPPPSPPAAAPAPPPPRTEEDALYLFAQWFVTGETALGKLYRLLAASLLMAVFIIVVDWIRS